MSNLPHTSVRSAGITTFYATREYYEQLTTDVQNAGKGDRILLVTMSYELRKQLIISLIEALEACAHRGAEVVLQIDANSFLEDTRNHIGPLFWHKELPKKLSGVFKTSADSLARLHNAGAKVVITNMPKRALSGPMIGRSHIKTSIINDKIYIGGCNLSDLHLDTMVSWHDKKTADWLFELMCRRLQKPHTIQAFGVKDIRHTIDADSEILVDVGAKKQSLIYEEALAIIDHATEWILITCQFFPHSTTAEHLKRAHNRGVKVVPIFNHYKTHFPLSRPAQYAVRTRERMRMPTSFFDYELAPRTTYLHAKLIATEQEALIGSHNYVPEGVNFGTAEIALHNKTAAFSQAAAQLVVEEVGLAKSPGLSFLFK